MGAVMTGTDHVIRVTGRDDGPFFLPETPSMPDALCTQVYPDLFFPEVGEVNTAPKSVCRNCPEQITCLEYALDHEVMGIWGGTSNAERRKLRRLRKAAG